MTSFKAPGSGTFIGPPASGAVLMQVICTTLDLRGAGVKGDPMRRITQYWSLDGSLLAEVDPWTADRRDADLRDGGS